MNMKVRTRLDLLKRALVILFCISLLSISSIAQVCRSGSSSSNDRVQAAAQRGDPGAALKVAKAFYNGGVGSKRSYYNAFKWFEIAANSGSTEAKAWLGACYLFGLGVKPDLSRGKDLIEAAANEGSPVGARFLGLMYQRGIALPRDFPKAISLLRKSKPRSCRASTASASSPLVARRVS